MIASPLTKPTAPTHAIAAVILCTAAAFTCAAVAPAPAAAQDADPRIAIDVEVFAGRSVVPPDIIESDIDQERLAAAIGSDATVTYRQGDTRLFAGAGVEVFPTDNLLNRYALGLGASQDVPIANNGRVRLRLGARFDHVSGDEGRVYDRVRADGQLILRHGAGHTSLARFRYGYRDQSEARFSGFDQSEWLSELRHTYRPPGSQSAINLAAIIADVDAEDDRYSYRGLGFRVIGSAPLGDDFLGYARASYFGRDYEDRFSNLYPIARRDDVWRVSAGVEHPLTRSLNGLIELGYIDHQSNIPTRDFSGLTGRVGVRWRLEP